MSRRNRPRRPTKTPPRRVAGQSRHQIRPAIHEEVPPSVRRLGGALKWVVSKALGAVVGAVFIAVAAHTLSAVGGWPSRVRRCIPTSQSVLVNLGMVARRQSWHVAILTYARTGLTPARPRADNQVTATGIRSSACEDVRQGHSRMLRVLPLAVTLCDHASLLSPGVSRADPFPWLLTCSGGGAARHGARHCGASQPSPP